MPGVDLARPANGQRHPRASVVDGGFRAREWHAVVGGDDDDGVVEFTRLLQRRQHGPDVAVEALHLEVVVEQVASHLRGVRQERRHRDPCRAATERGAAAWRVRSVRIGTAEPETERTVSRPHLQEGREVVESRTRRIASAPTRLDPARPPPLAGVADDVTGRLEEIGIDGVRAREGAPEVAGVLEPVDRLAGQERRARRGARRRRGEGMREERAFARDAVEIRGAHGPVAVGAGVAERPVVGNGDHDVRPSRRRRLPRAADRDRGRRPHPGANVQTHGRASFGAGGGSGRQHGEQAKEHVTDEHAGRS